MNLDEMSAGREMDALVWLVLAGKPLDLLLTCRRVDGDVQPHAGYPMGHISPPHYSTEIAAAWEVVTKLGLHVGPWVVSGPGYATWYAASCHDWNEDGVVVEVAKTVELAICRAALRIVGEKGDSVGERAGS